jgi:uroporphyrinogen-III synthase
VTDTAAPSEAGPLPLAGYTVAVTAARRKEELGALLDRRGARVVYAPAIRIVPLSDDAELVAATRAVLEKPVDLVVATTGVGFRGWLEAADAWDLPLVEHLLSARVLARGPKARGAIRGGGLVDAWSPESESSAEVLAHLLSGAEGPLEGRRIAVQLHGDPLPDLVTGLRETGAEVLTVPVYRWVLPQDVAPVRRLVDAIVTGGIDAVTFTSAPAAASLLTVADELGLREALVAAFNGRVLAIAVGSVTAGPLDAAGDPQHAARAGAARRAGPRGGGAAARARSDADSRPARHPGARLRRGGGRRAGRAGGLADGGAAGARPPSRRRRPWDRVARVAARQRGRGHRRDGRDPAAGRARRPGRRDRRRARLPPGGLTARAAPEGLVERRRDGHHAGVAVVEGSRS